MPENAAVSISMTDHLRNAAGSRHRLIGQKRAISANLQLSIAEITSSETQSRPDSAPAWRQGQEVSGLCAPLAESGPALRGQGSQALSPLGRCDRQERAWTLPRIAPEQCIGTQTRPDSALDAVEAFFQRSPGRACPRMQQRLISMTDHLKNAAGSRHRLIGQKRAISANLQLSIAEITSSETQSRPDSAPAWRQGQEVSGLCAPLAESGPALPGQRSQASSSLGRHDRQERAWTLPRIAPEQCIGTQTRPDSALDAAEAFFQPSPGHACPRMQQCRFR